MRLLVSIIIGCLYIPALNLIEPVGFAPLVDGVHDVSHIGDGIARAEGYNWGRTDKGRTIILGHNPGGFSDLDKLVVGDQILIYADWTGGQFAEYRVIDIYLLREGYTGIFTDPIMHYELNLITCYDAGRWLVVRALPVLE